jgi:heterodisulfide reductase subunit A-like polyferredoxin
MPADRPEIEDALAEGVRLETLVAPLMVRKTSSGLTVSCQRMRLTRPDDSGRRRPVPIEGSDFELHFDSVLSAIGQFPEIPKELGVEVNPKSQQISVCPDTFATPVEGVFAGGDVVSGPASVVQAIAHGRRAAIAIDRFLGGDGNIHEKLAPPEDMGSLVELEPENDARRRLPLQQAHPRQRVRGFDAVERVWSKKDAMEEASRCLRCDLGK